MQTRTSPQHLSETLQASRPGHGRVLRWAYLYWLAFLLCLEPDQVLRAARAGNTLELLPELLRMGLAAMLGTAATPFLLRLAERHDAGLALQQWRSTGWVLLNLLLLSGGLILAAGVLAAWVFQGRIIPRLIDLQHQLQSDGLLLTFALAGLLVLIQLKRPQARTTAPLQACAEAAPTPKPAWLTAVTLSHLGRSRTLPLDTVSWIETQGNYVALHTGSHTHLLRESLGRLESQLDPLRFTRIHRRLMVALDEVRALSPLSNGDATITLANGQRLRVSRSYRRTFQARWAGPYKAPRSSPD